MPLLSRHQQVNMGVTAGGLDDHGILFQFPGDGLWYRGTIVEVVDQQKVKVSFSDFGNIDTVPLSKLKTISADLLQLPPQVIQCGISSISPVGGAEWSDDSIERFCNLIMHKRLLGKVIKKGSVPCLSYVNPSGQIYLSSFQVTFY